MTGGLSKAAREDLDARIKDSGTRAAFVRLTKGLESLGTLTFRPNINGHKKAVHLSSGRVSYFSFIANNHWLLWYFRAPGFRDRIFSWEGLREQFPDIEPSKRTDPEKTEGVLRISSEEQADAVLEFISELRF